MAINIDVSAPGPDMDRYFNAANLQAARTANLLRAQRTTFDESPQDGWNAYASTAEAIKPSQEKFAGETGPVIDLGDVAVESTATITSLADFRARAETRDLSKTPSA